MSGNDDAQNLSPESKAFKFGLDVINQSEPQIADYIRAELENQRSQLKLIASENYASPAVLLAMGNWFSDKYAEGTPGIDSTPDVSLLIKLSPSLANMRRIYLGLIMLMSNLIQELTLI